ncbi:hypothetical protein [Streptomyces sp. 1222.5]|uniref:hypothetical protein n=1 Tax=Streptomyces sp. 1222.5 TaxID=1881026 RepID=UPI003EB7985F
MKAAAPSLADRARELQRLAAVGSIRRKAAGVLAVAVDTTRTAAGARRILTTHPLPTEIRDAAVKLLDELTTPEEQPPCPE